LKKAPDVIKEVPQNLDAEQATLGSMMISNDAVIVAMDILKPHYFYDKRHAILFSVIIDMVNNGEAVEYVTLTERLRIRRLARKAGGIAYVTQLMGSVPTAAMCAYYANLVRDKYRLRKVQTKAIEILDMVNTAESVEDLMEPIDNMRYYTQVVQSSGFNLGEVCKENRNKYMARDSHAVCKAGLEDLSNILPGGGWCPGDLYIIGARPSMGKTDFALFELVNMAAEDIPVVIFSLEMDTDKLLYRLRGRVMDEIHKELRDNHKDKIAIIEAADSVIEHFPLIIDERPGLTIEQIVSTARKWHLMGRCNAVFIDYFQLMRFPKRGKDRLDIVMGRASNALKNLAKEIGGPVFLLSQLNRNLEQRENKRPRMADLRECGSLEQDADGILFLYRHWKYDPEAPENVTEILVEKLRDSVASVTIPVRYEAPKSNFICMTPEDKFTYDRRWR